MLLCHRERHVVTATLQHRHEALLVRRFHVCFPGLDELLVNEIVGVGRFGLATLERLGEDTLAAHAPLRRLGDDEDLKGTCLLFASDAGKHITGQWLAVDGGVSIITGG